jgi:hypothetical protein
LPYNSSLACEIAIFWSACSSALCKKEIRTIRAENWTGEGNWRVEDEAVAWTNSYQLTIATKRMHQKYAYHQYARETLLMPSSIE